MCTQVCEIMTLLVTRRGCWYLLHIRILELFIKQTHAYVGLSDDDRCILAVFGVQQMKVADFM